MPNHDVAVQFGKLVRKFRIDAKLSQEELAQNCGLHRTYIGAVERGEKNVTLNTALKIASALGVALSIMIARLEAETNTNADEPNG